MTMLEQTPERVIGYFQDRQMITPTYDLVTKCRGGHAVHCLELTMEMAEVGKAAFERDGGDRCAGGSQYFYRLFNALGIALNDEALAGAPTKLAGQQTAR